MEVNTLINHLLTAAIDWLQENYGYYNSFMSDRRERHSRMGTAHTSAPKSYCRENHCHLSLKGDRGEEPSCYKHIVNKTMANVSLGIKVKLPKLTLPDTFKCSLSKNGHWILWWKFGAKHWANAERTFAFTRKCLSKCN